MHLEYYTITNSEMLIGCMSHINLTNRYNTKTEQPHLNMLIDKDRIAIWI